MHQVTSVTFRPGSREELLPDFDPGFPCITSRYLFPDGDAAPWHWHGALELFYIDSGCLEYVTPSARHSFHTGSGGLLMANVPHMTRGCRVQPGDTQLLHLFEPELISGQTGSRIEREYVLPLLSRGELIVLTPENPDHMPVLELLRRSFALCPDEPGYELRLRNILSEIFLLLYQLPAPREKTSVQTSELIRQIMVYVHGHYMEKISVAELGRAVCISERVCYNLFRKHMNMSPMEYVTDCRIRVACRMLAQSEESVTAIALACGFSAGSHFSQVFREYTGMTPRDYRRQTKEISSEP